MAARGRASTHVETSESFRIHYLGQFLTELPTLPNSGRVLLYDPDLVENRDETLLDGLDDLDVPAVGVVVLLGRGAGAVYLLLEGQLDGVLAALAPGL